MDGVFYNIMENGVTVLKFYKDSQEVIGSTFSGVFTCDETFLKMFDKDSPVSSLWEKSNYTINGNEVSFELNMLKSTYFFSGVINSSSEIILKSVNLKDGRKNLSKFNSISDFPLINNQIEVSSSTYPIILIPHKIKNALINDINDEDIYNSLNIEQPKLNKLKEPIFPDEYKYITREKTEYKGNIWLAITIIPMVIFFIYMFFFTIGKGNIFLSIVFLIAVFVIGKNLGRFKTITINEKVYLPRAEFNNLVNEYNKKKLEIENKNIELEKIYHKKKVEIENKIESIKQDIVLIEYQKKLKPIQKTERNLENIKRGKSELMFLDKLYNKFGDQIKVDLIPDIDSDFYYPDFTFICNKTGLHIDIEIDEPYTLLDKKPIHHIESNDDVRNKFFLDKNWIVIRFTENQIKKYSNECIELIDNTVNAIINKSDLIDHNVPLESKWNYEEALVMSYNNTRNN